MKQEKEKDARKVVASNRRAHVKYAMLETLEAGIVLTGPEVKSLRAGNANLSEGFCRVEGEQMYLWNVHISPYAQGGIHVIQEPLRTRKLLLNRSEINKWMGRVMTKGLTIVPLEIYFNKAGKAKVLIALAKGKRGPDRRDDIKRRTIDREVAREFSGRHKIK